MPVIDGRFKPATGDWTIVIHGRGSHHNGLRRDVDRLMQVFVADLNWVGHDVFHARITTGDGEDVAPSGASGL